jgi:hypothetical protein
MVKVDIPVHDKYRILIVRLDNLNGLVHAGKLNVREPTVQPLWRRPCVAHTPSENYLNASEGKKNTPKATRTISPNSMKDCRNSSSVIEYGRFPMKRVPEGATGFRKPLGFELRSSYRDSSYRSAGDVDNVRCHCNGVESFPKLTWRNKTAEGSEL